MLIIESIYANQTEIISTTERFQRILNRKRRYLLFPPGSAIIVSFENEFYLFSLLENGIYFYFLRQFQATFSYTKTLVPRSPSGINMLGEFDVSYPLQTTISDWFPTTKAPATPEPEYYEDDEDTADNDDVNGNSNNTMINPMIPIPPQPQPFQPQIQPQQQQQYQPQPLPQSFIPTPLPSFVRPSVSPPFDSLSSTENPITNNFTPKVPNSILQENGVLTSDPNYNAGRHPGEIYVRNDKKVAKNRQQQQPQRQQQQNFANRKFTKYSIAKNPNYSPNWMNENELWQYRNYEWHPPKLLSQNKMNEYRLRRFSKKNIKTIQTNYAKEKQRKYARERRNLYEQIQSLPIL